MTARSGSFPSIAGRQVAALLLDVGARNLVPAPPSQLSQSLLHQTPHFRSAGDPTAKGPRAFPVYIFLLCGTNPQPTAAAPAAVITPAISARRRARVRFGTAALRQGFRKALQHVESNPRVRQRLSRRITSGVSLIPCDTGETSTHQS